MLLSYLSRRRVGITTSGTNLRFFGGMLARSSTLGDIRVDSRCRPELGLPLPKLGIEVLSDVPPSPRRETDRVSLNRVERLEEVVDARAADENTFP